MAESSKLVNVRRGEWPFVATMFGYFFLVITTFWILKPLKKSLFITHYDASGIDFGFAQLSAAQGELVAKVLNMVIAFVAALVFTQLSRSLRRQQLSYVFTALSLVAFAVYAMLVKDAGAATVWTFYLFGDLYNTLMVATFFAFLNDSVLPDETKRLYGPVIFGGVVGGVVGSSLVAGWISKVSVTQWLLVCIGLGLLTGLTAAIAGRIVAGRAIPEKDAAPEPQHKASVFEGARLVMHSPYLAAIVAVVGLYEIASTLLDFMFTATTAHYLSGSAIGAHFARVFSLTNWASMFVQLFLTGAIMSRLGLASALSVQPAAMSLASVAFLLSPTLWIGSLLSSADNAFAYSLNQSAKEALYTPTTRDEKYAAKAFIDMFVQRFAKAVAVVVSLVVTSVFTDFSAVRWLAIAVVLLGAVWLRSARYAGREFEARSTRH